MALHENAHSVANRTRQVFQEVLSFGVGDLSISILGRDPVVLSNVVQDGAAAVGIQDGEESGGFLGFGHCYQGSGGLSRLTPIL